ncbi:hypothetical protein HDU98_009971 [Podochytrium sp. JEL0797]|nr:hypothetical protein HDU98_009971 [Podochytrium sp. JEL0797]
MDSTAITTLVPNGQPIGIVIVAIGAGVAILLSFLSVVLYFSLQRGKKVPSQASNRVDSDDQSTTQFASKSCSNGVSERFHSHEQEFEMPMVPKKPKFYEADDFFDGDSMVGTARAPEPATRYEWGPAVRKLERREVEDLKGVARDHRGSGRLEI